MTQDRKPSSSAVHIQRKGKLLWSLDVHVLVREYHQKGCERVVKEVIYVKLDWPSLNRGGGLWLSYLQHCPDIPPICSHFNTCCHNNTRWSVGQTNTCELNNPQRVNFLTLRRLNTCKTLRKLLDRKQNIFKNYNQTKQIVTGSIKIQP